MASKLIAENSHSRPFEAILWGGLACGVLDITAAFVVYSFFGAKPVPLLQGIASGLLGPRAYDGGLATAFLGLACHFFIAYSAAIVYFAASCRASFLVDHAVLSGLLYGPAIYFFMNQIILPLSAIGRRPFSLKFMVIGVVIHSFCVGLPIALSVRRYFK